MSCNSPESIGKTCVGLKKSYFVNCEKKSVNLVPFKSNIFNINRGDNTISFVNYDWNEQWWASLRDVVTALQITSYFLC
jgi:hypothetical protein